MNKEPHYNHSNFRSSKFGVGKYIVEPLEQDTIGEFIFYPLTNEGVLYTGISYTDLGSRGGFQCIEKLLLLRREH